MWIAPSVSNSSRPTTGRPFLPRKTSRHGAGCAADAATGSITGSIGLRVSGLACEAVVDSNAMEYTHVGRFGLAGSRLCLGTINFGPPASEEDSHTILDTAVAYGINFVDTANVYGRHLGVGATGETLRRWCAKRGRPRDTVVLARKVYGQMGDLPNESPMSKLSIIHQCEASL